MSLKYAVLGLLNYDSMTGYDLKKIFDDSISNFWSASLSQIYRELGSMEKQGYLTSSIEQQDDRPNKRIYNITESGKSAFEKWIISYPEKLTKEKRDEFTLRLFFGSNIDKKDLITQLKRFIDENQTNLEKIITLNQISEKYINDMKLFNNEGVYWRLILKRAYMVHETSITWANECITELNNEIGNKE